MLTDEQKFFIYLLEHYADYKKVPTARVLATWDASDLTDYIKAMYWQFHTERLENAFEEIDGKLKQQNLAY